MTAPRPNTGDRRNPRTLRIMREIVDPVDGVPLNVESRQDLVTAIQDARQQEDDLLAKRLVAPPGTWPHWPGRLAREQQRRARLERCLIVWDRARVADG